MISVIIPVLNEQKTLPGTLASVFDQVGDYEVIVIDGGSNDGTVAVANQNSVARVIRAPTGRASQMNAGAAVANGEWLLFLHGDTRLPEGAMRSITGLDKDQGVQAGGFRHCFSDAGPGLRLISWINNHRCARTRVFYGDQAPFVRQILFERLGGFPDQPILEDVLFMEKLLQVTTPVMLPAEVVTDSRRFRQQGILRSFGRVFLILSCHKLGLNIPTRKFFAPVR
jgi:rSAM/selenodomain-associated transferase 2